MEGRTLLGLVRNWLCYRFEENFVKMLIVLETPTLGVDWGTVITERLLTESHPDPVTVTELVNDVESPVNRDNSDLLRLKSWVQSDPQSGAWLGHELSQPVDLTRRSASLGLTGWQLALGGIHHLHLV